MLWQRIRRVDETLLTATRADSTVYAVISYVDGGLGIARDGQPLTPFYWPSQEMDDCVATFMRLAGLDDVHIEALSN